MIAPASTGPIARLRLNETPFAEIALESCSLGTSLGTTACHVGRTSAPETLIRNINHKSDAGVTQFIHTTAAKTADSTAVMLSPQINKRLRSTMSESAPATSASRNTGALL